MLLQRLCLSVAFVLLVVGTLPAQNPASADTVRIEDLVVTATRQAVSRRQVPATVTAVSGEELRARGFRFVADWIQEVPGVAVVPTGSFGGVTSLFVRGGESDYTKILVDGIATNLPGGAIDLANFSLENVERIEVLRGPASVLYGSDAVTGVIQILTRTGTGPGRFGASARAGSAGTSDLRVSHAGQEGKANWSAHVARFGSSGTYDFNNSYRSLTGSGRLGLHPDDQTDLAVTFRAGDSESHFPTDFAGVPSDSNQYNTERSLTVGFDGGRRLSESVSLRLAGSVFNSQRGFDDAPDGPGDNMGYGFASSRDATDRRGTVDARVLWSPTARLVLTGGMEWLRESADETSTSSSDFGDGAFTENGQFEASRTNTAWYSQAQLTALKGVEVHGGLRLEDNSVFGTFGTWRVGVVFNPSPAWRIHGSAGTAFRQPTFAEQFADTPYEVGNPDLNPERGRTWELGVESRVHGGAIILSATWFDQQFREMIQYQFTDPGSPTYQNLAEAAAWGLEVGGRWNLSTAFSLSLGYTRLLTEVVEAGSTGPAFETGQSLLRRPPHSGTAGVRWLGRSGGRVQLDLVVVGSRDDVDYSSFPAARVAMESYQVVSVSTDFPLRSVGGWVLPVDLGVTARVDNLFDSQYQTIVGYPGRGRIVLAGFRIGR